MKRPPDTRPPAFDAAAIHATIERALRSAGLDTSEGRALHGVTETLQRTLGGAGLAPAAPPVDGATVIDVHARTVPDADDATPPRPDAEPVGRAEVRAFANAAGRRNYTVYLPRAAARAPRPMLVMLHGCTQSADDFAAGTQMNRLADEHGFLVVYPEQSAQANPSRCWNWFRPQDQLRDAGEPALIAGIVRDAAQRHGGDLRRVFVAGLSAGAAMALALGETYPELFAGVGVHSGLPYGSAHDIASAMAAMKGGRSGLPGLRQAAAAPGAPGRRATQAVPLIVFHGDRDHTVHQANAAQIVRQAHEAHEADAAQRGAAALRVSRHEGVAPGGRAFSRTVHADAAGRARIECWTLHGAGHAWSGGHASGSFTDASGPDASAAMVRFFLAQPPRGA